MPPHLDPFLVAITLDDPVDVDAGDVDVLCCKCAHVYNLLHLKTERRPAEGDNEIKVSCFFVIQRKKLKTELMISHPTTN